jgi:threonyl-tRNA synthetase
VRAVYGVFSFEFRLRLSTRPDDAMGSDEQWAAAEAALREALTRFGHSWAENPKDGAFYGPKIDVAVLDALGREHQCATVQLDFNLPQRFDLAFVNERGARERPVLVHRAVLGSLERFIALLTEHLAGRWPFWLSPRQVAVLPVSRKALLHARAVQRALEAAELWAEVDETDATLARKVREAQTAGFNVMAVVGEAEAAAGAVAVRAPRHGEAAGDGQQLPLADFIARLSALAASRA